MTEQLKLAVSYNDENIVSVFLQLGTEIDVNVRTGERSLTLLQVAVRNNNEAVTRMLLKRGADVNAASDDGLTALHVAVANRSLTMVELLLEFNADVNPKSKFLEKTPLYMAVEYRCLEIAELLLRRGASVKEATIRNTTILHVALRIGEPRLARLVLRHAYKEHIDLQDNTEGKSPLHLAVERQHHDIVKTLLQKGANIDQIYQNSTDETYDPLSLAINCKDDKMAALLLQNGAKKSIGECLHRAIKQRCQNIVVRLLKSKIVEVDHVGKDGLTALQIAVMSGYKDMVEICLEHGASLTAKSANTVPLLYFAIKNGDTAMVDLLIKQGASIHAPITKNVSLLDVAVKKRNAELTSHLLKRGSVINVNSSTEEQIFAIKRIAILVSENQKVSDKNLNLIKTMPLWSRLYERCQEEIERTKSDIVSGSISSYDILTKDDNTLATYASNEEYLNAFAKSALKKKYRIYADSLAQSFTRGRVRYLLLQKASDELKKMGMESASAQQVLKPLSIEDLKSFIKGVCKCATAKHRCLPQLYVPNYEWVTGSEAF